MYIKDIKNYIFELNFKLIYEKNKLYIANYKRIDHFDANKINIIHNDGKVIIMGTSLGINKMLSNEILISGNIKEIIMEKNED